MVQGIRQLDGRLVQDLLRRAGSVRRRQDCAGVPDEDVDSNGLLVVRSRPALSQEGCRIISAVRRDHRVMLIVTSFHAPCPSKAMRPESKFSNQTRRASTAALPPAPSFGVDAS